MRAHQAHIPAVSVLMPCYHAASTLEEALDSLDRQTLRDFEIVAVDDGSTDDTLQLLHERAERDSRLRVIAQEHAGIISALNAGLAACHAPYIARMDIDDYSYPERLALQVAYLNTHPGIAVVGPDCLNGI